MHSNLSSELYRAEAADRVRRARRAPVPPHAKHPPPLRGRAAYVAARLAHRLDSESAKRAVA